MAHAQLATIPSKQVHLADLISSEPSSSPLLYLLPPCMILLAIDVVLRLSQRTIPIQGQELEAEAAVEIPAERIVEESKARYDEKLRRLGLRAHEVLSNFRELESNLSATSTSTAVHSSGSNVSGPKCRTQSNSPSPSKQRNFAHHRHRLAVYSATQGQGGESPSPTCTTSSSTRGVSKPFTAFCDKLLLQNRIWAQQKEIKALQRRLESTKSKPSDSSSAFKALCDRLLLSNTIWRLQREVQSLTDETEKLKRSRVAAVTRAAKQMVQDLRKERLTEEFVKDLIAEVDEHRRTMGELRKGHEKEVREMAEVWKRDYTRMRREIERLELAQEARRVEQDLSNLVEDDLVFAGDHQHGKMDAEDDAETLSGGTDDEQMSNLSASTVVGSAGQLTPNRKFSFEEDPTKTLPTPMSTPAFKKRAAAQKLSPLKMPRRAVSSISLRSSTTTTTSPTTTKTPIRKPDPVPYVGFSFNPLFFGNASVTRRDDAGDALPGAGMEKSPLGGRKPGSLSVTSISTNVSMNTSEKGKQALPRVEAPKRVPWRG